MGTRTISCQLNGKKVKVEAPTTVNLLRLLREYLDVTGPKFGCEQGNCGACTVLLDGEPVNSCLVLAATVDGRQGTTVGGIGTPGMIFPAYALLKKNPNPTRDDVVNALVGNVCRCTGYNKIVESVLAAAEDMREGGMKMTDTNYVGKRI